MEDEINLIELITNSVTTHLKNNQKHKKQWNEVIKDLNKIADLIILEQVTEERTYRQKIFENRLKKLKITISQNINVSIKTYEKLNKYLDSYEKLHFTKEQVVSLIESYLIEYHKPLTVTDINKFKLELEQKKLKCKNRKEE